MGDDDRFFTELRACTAELGRIIDSDLDRPVPTCPGWTFKQLATHVGRGHRWAAQIVATRASAPVSTRDVPNGRMPDDPSQHQAWLAESADLVADAVTAVGDEPVWTFTGPRPARWWARRRAHEAAVHLADAQLAAGRDVDLAPAFAADGVDEWLGLVVASTATRTRRASWAATGRPCTSTPPIPGWTRQARTGRGSGWSPARRPASPWSQDTPRPTWRSAPRPPACCSC